MAGSAGVYPLPPRARARDWPLAGACAGLVLTLAEQLVTAANGIGLPPSLALLLALGNVVLVATPCVLIGLIARARRARPSHSSVVVGVVGPLLFAAVALPALLRGDASGGVLALVLLLAIGVGTWLAAGLADRMERAGIAASGPFVWGGTALLLAGSARLAAGPAPKSAFAGLIAAAILVVAGAAIAHEVIRRRGGGGRMRFGPLLGLLVAATGLSATLPLWLPWVLVDGSARPSGRGSTNLLILALPAAEIQPTLDLLAIEGTERARIAPEALLGTPGGWIARGLTRAGYETAAIVRDPRRAHPRGAAELDARPGGRGLLEGPAAWMVATPLLLGPAYATLRLVGQDTYLRSPGAIAAVAKRWLLDSHARHAAAPFFLFVDLRGTPEGDADGALGAILDRLELIGAVANTAVVVATTGAAGRVVVRAAETDLPFVLTGTTVGIAMTTPVESESQALPAPPSS